MKRLNFSRLLFLVLLLLFLVFSPLYCSENGIIITESELNELESTLRIADEQLTISQTEIMRLNSLLNEQDKELTTLKTELDKALVLLKKSENEITFNGIRLVLVGIGACAVGCIIGYMVGVRK